MADIPVSTVVNVSIATTPQAPTKAGFGTLLFVTTDAENAGEIPLAEGVRLYASIAEVGDDWATTTEVYKAANTCFSQSPAPTQFAVGAEDVGDATLQDTLTRLADKSTAWYAFTLNKASRDSQDVLDAAEWAEARVKLFFTETNEAGAYDPGSTTDYLYLLNAQSYRRTYVQYSGTAAEYPASSVFGIIATTDFAAENSVKTVNLKNLPGITADSLASGDLTALADKGGNAYVEIGGIDVVRDGRMSKGVGVWLDAVHAVDALQAEIENNVYAYLVATPNVPLTDAGVSAIVQQVENALAKFVRNGLIAPGTTVSGDFLPLGYDFTVGRVADMALVDKQARKSPPIQFRAIGAGAIQGVTILGVFEG